MNSVTVPIDDQYIKSALMIFFEGREPSEKQLKAVENYVKANLHGIVSNLVLCNITSEVVEVLEAEWQEEWADLPPMWADLPPMPELCTIEEEIIPDLADPEWLESLDKLGQ